MTKNVPYPECSENKLAIMCTVADVSVFLEAKTEIAREALKILLLVNKKMNRLTIHLVVTLFIT